MGFEPTTTLTQGVCCTAVLQPLPGGAEVSAESEDQLFESHHRAFREHQILNNVWSKQEEGEEEKCPAFSGIRTRLRLLFSATTADLK